jgi:hypothetical protein
MSEKCTSSTVQTWILRLLATGLVGVAAYIGINALVNTVWHTQIDPLYAGLGATAVAGVMLALIWNATIFTEECLGMDTAIAPAFKGGKAARCAPGNCARDDARKNPGGSTGAKPVTAAPFPLAGTIARTDKLTVEAASETDGTTTITISTNGLSNSQLKGNNGLFMRVNSVKGVTWSNHKNVGEGRKQVQGKIAANSSERQTIYARLAEIAQRYQ